YLLYLLIDFGKRLSAPGITLILDGIVALLATLSGTIIQINWTKDLAGRSNMGDAIIGIVAPPVIQRILSVWFLFGAAAIILGVMLFFIKKPYTNKGNKSK
ncbi:MAG: hypothetical protein NTZ07_03700, partial [Candidatus Woesebacteria bacterium]|nr:hypothetical protein [Candidatus Woesebacteria bacterium]